MKGREQSRPFAVRSEPPTQASLSTEWFVRHELLQSGPRATLSTEWFPRAPTGSESPSGHTEYKGPFMPYLFRVPLRLR